MIVLDFSLDVLAGRVDARGEMNAQQEYEAGREAARKAAQNVANACNLANIHPCDMNEVVRLREEARELRAKAVRFGCLVEL